MTQDTTVPLSKKYPRYYKEVQGLTEVDVYAVHYLFHINDPSGCIQHASKKLLLAGSRTGGKTLIQDITEARDTLNRWLELNTRELRITGIESNSKLNLGNLVQVTASAASRP